VKSAVDLSLCNLRNLCGLFVPTNNGLPPAKAGVEVVEDARKADIARALENGVSVIRADVAGRADGLVAYGSSEIVDHHGTVLQAAGQLEVGLLVADIEPLPRSYCARRAMRQTLAQSAFCLAPGRT
jgi:predicted amidohydrolase